MDLANEVKDVSTSTDRHIIISGALTCLVGSGIFYVMPAFVGGATQKFSLTNFQAGLLPGAESFAIMLSCALAAALIGRFGRSVVAISAGITLVGHIITGIAPNFETLLAVRVVTGLLGEGPLYAASYIILSRARNPDRAFGWALVVISVVAAMVLEVQSDLLQYGLIGLVAPLILASAALVLASPFLPHSRESSEIQPELPEMRSASRSQGWLILASVAIWFAAPGFYWAFAANLGTSGGLLPEQIGRALSISTLAGIVALFLPVIVGERFGRTGPLVLASLGAAIAAWMSLSVGAYLQFTIAVSLFYVCWNVTAVYQLATLSVVDSTGRFAGLGATAQLIGLSVGPIIGGWLLDAFGLGATPFVIFAFVGTGLACYLLARHRRSSHVPHV